MSNNQKFTPYLLKSILTLLLNDEEYREKYFPVLRLEHFEVSDKMIYTLAQAIFGMYEKYAKFPSVEALVEEIFRQKGSNIELFNTEPTKEEFEALLNFVGDIVEGEVTDRKYVEDNTLRILSFLSVQKVILDYRESFTNGSLDVDSFTKDIVTASTFSTPLDLGVNLYDNLDKRTEERASTEVTPGVIELNIPYFAKHLEEGGLPPGSLGFILAPTNGGKSSALIHIAHDAALRKNNVLYVTAELSEDMIKRRFDACMTGVPINEIKKQAGTVRGRIMQSPLFQETAKHLRVLEVPTGTARVADLDAAVERLKKIGWNTNLLVVDYADNLRAGKKSESYRHEVTAIYQDLRALAQKHHLVCWTASQMNDAGSEAAEKKGGVITIRHVNEARGKIHLADLCVAVARTQEEKEAGLARLVLLKNRLGSGDGLVAQVTTRFDISRIFGDEKHIIPMTSINADEEIAGLNLTPPPDTWEKSTPRSLSEKYNTDDE